MFLEYDFKQEFERIEKIHNECEKMYKRNLCHDSILLTFIVVALLCCVHLICEADSVVFVIMGVGLWLLNCSSLHRTIKRMIRGRELRREENMKFHLAELIYKLEKDSDCAEEKTEL